jgi:transcriptional regulator with XRE-family HTH domain
MKIKDINVCLRLGVERKRLNLHQNDVARYCDVSVKTVGRWEKNIPIPADKLALLTHLGYDITYILTAVKLAPQAAGLDVATKARLTPVADQQQAEALAVSNEQVTWLGILEHLAGGDQERLKQIGLALVGYSQARSNKPSS